MGCMNTRDTMTVRFAEILYYTLGQEYPTGQGQNRTESVKKKRNKFNSEADGSSQVKSHAPAWHTRWRVKMTVRLSGLLEHPLERQ